MSRRTAARLGWSLFGLSALLLGVAFLLSLRRPQYSDLLATTGELLFGLVIVLLFGWFGALIVPRQPSQPIGWILCALAGTVALTFFANEYAIYGLITDPGAVPGAAAVAWFAIWAFAIPLGLLTALLLLFPTGRPPRRTGAGGCGWPPLATSCSSSPTCRTGRCAAPASSDWTSPTRPASPACCTRSAPRAGRLPW